MRKPNRTTECRTLFPLLHASRISPPSSSTNLHPKHHRNPQLPPLNILTSTLISFMKQCLPMTGMHNSIYGQNTPLWPTPLTTKSARRSTNCRIHSPSRYPPKTRGLWYATNHNTTKPRYRLHSIPIPSIILMRNNHNQLHLPTSDRPKITHRVLLCQPHSTSNRSHPHSNTMKLHRSNSPNNRPRPHFLNTILPGKLKL